MQQTWQEIFSSVTDSRSLRNQKYALETILGIAIIGGIAGIDSFSGLADFAESHRRDLQKYFDLPDKTPSHDTFQRVLDAISTQEFYACFHEFTQTISRKFSDTIISIDGKTIRNSGAGGEQSLHLVNAWSEANSLVLAAVKVDKKSNEITAIPKILSLFDVAGKIITIDAMGAQRQICSQITASGGDYVIALKGNQGTLHADAKLFLDDHFVEKDLLKHTENDKGHGRLEARSSFVTDDIDFLRGHDWPGLKSIGKVVANVIRKGEKSTETRYYISSLPADARRFGEIARAHWGIENKLHWRLDVVANEDAACITNENAAENMSLIRKWALNILHQAIDKKGRSLKSLQRKAAMSFDFLASIVNKYFHA
jgi:hypothetical protein